MNEIPKTRQSLLLQLGKQSDDAWSEFLVIYEKALYRFCLAKGLQDADAQDVLQDVFTAVIKRISTWNPDSNKGSFRGWLFRVARNIAVDAINRRAKKGTTASDSQVDRLITTAVTGDQPSESLFEIEYQRSVFDWASKQVKSEVREITWLSFCKTALDGQKAEHVAAELGTSVGSVYTAKCRVVARIRSKIAEMDDEIEPPIE